MSSCGVTVSVSARERRQFPYELQPAERGVFRQVMACSARTSELVCFYDQAGVITSHRRVIGKTKDGLCACGMIFKVLHMYALCTIRLPP